MKAEESARKDENYQHNLKFCPPLLELKTKVADLPAFVRTKHKFQVLKEEAGPDEILIAEPNEASLLRLRPEGQE